MSDASRGERYNRGSEHGRARHASTPAPPASRRSGVEPVSARRGQVTAQPLHVLVVEDDPLQRESLETMLRLCGCKVSVATDGTAAFRAACADPPDVILMDLSMPSMNGIEATRRIRAMAATRSSHIIVLSACADARARQLAFEAGCNQFVLKPYDVESALRAFVARRGDRTMAAAK